MPAPNGGGRGGSKNKKPAADTKLMENVSSFHCHFDLRHVKKSPPLGFFVPLECLR
jgi:hypothetical protein